MTRRGSPLAPWTPSAAEPWDAEAAGHLLRRGGFRPSLAEIDAAVELGPDAAVDRLVRGEPIVAGPAARRHAELERIAGVVASGEDAERLRAWWLARMAASPHPLRDRLALAWHDHFAVSNAKVRSAPLMAGHLRILEDHALGSFRRMCRAIARDPAMIVWLDGNANVNGRPNENFARELFELFMLGLGAYDERDVREAARAFTGWHQRAGRFHFDRHLHDAGTKEVLGVRGPLDGDDVIEAALGHPACGRFVAGRLLRTLVHPQPAEELVDEVAAALRAADWALAPVVGRILRSRACLAAPNRRSRIATPVEHVIGLVRSLELDLPGRDLAEAAAAAGQRLLEPPTVDGWPEHRGWLDATRLLARVDLVRAACAPGRLRPGGFRRRHRLASAEEVLVAARRLTTGASVPMARIAGASPVIRARGDLDRLLAAAIEAGGILPEYQFV